MQQSMPLPVAARHTAAGWRRAQLRILMCVAMAAFTSAAVAQPHETSRGDLVLRASTVASASLNPATAAQHGIEVSPRRSVLNVVVMRGAARKTVAAEVTATSRTLAGLSQDIRMDRVLANGYVSYIGSYDFLPGEVVDFKIRARPLQPVKGRPLSLSFRERMRKSATP